MSHNLERFIEAQEHSYETALAEIRNGRKVSHWIWYVFPQIDGLGVSLMAMEFAIHSLDEARAYVRHPVLGARLREISQALLDLEETDPVAVMGHVDAMKLRSSMTLFSLAEPGETVFRDVLERYYGGEADSLTLAILAVEHAQ